MTPSPDAVAPDPDLSAAEPAVVSVRRARVNDAPAVARLQVTVLRHDLADALPAEMVTAADETAFARVWRDSLARPPARHTLVVACLGPRVVGWAALVPCADPAAPFAAHAVDASTGGRAVLDTWGVAPDHRRRGHGSRLLNAVADLARDDGFAAVDVWVPADGAAETFVRAAGFARDGATRGVPGLPLQVRLTTRL